MKKFTHIAIWVILIVIFLLCQFLGVIQTFRFSPLLGWVLFFVFLILDLKIAPMVIDKINGKNEKQK